MDSSKTRLVALRGRMRETDADLVALGPGPHMQWLAGFAPHADERPCLLLVGPEREAFLMPGLNAVGSRAHTDIRFFEWSDDTGPDQALSAALDYVGGANASRVVVDESMRASFALLVLDTLRGAAHTFTEATTGALRQFKDADEQAEIRRNAGIADRAMLAVQAAARPGIPERDLAAIARSVFQAEGAEPLFTIVGSGPNGAAPHHHTGDRKLAVGDAVVVDIGARQGSYSSDITRMLAIGRPPEGYGEVHAAVEAAVRAALAMARPGVPAKAVDAAARQVIAEAGYGEYFVHRTGHGLGLEGHEPPYITATSETILEAGMVFSIEPGIYLPGRFGIRLEDIVILHDDGPEILSGLSRDVFVTQEG